MCMGLFVQKSPISILKSTANVFKKCRRNKSTLLPTTAAKIQCPHCPKTFKNKRGLAGHMVVHM